MQTQPKFTLGMTLKRRLPRFPTAGRLARRLYTNLQFTAYVLRHSLWRAALRIAKRPAVRLRKQAVLEWSLPLSDVATAAEQLVASLRERGMVVQEGSHALYLPPQDALERFAPKMVRSYPANSGFKVLRDLRPPEQASYLSDGAIARWRRHLIGTPLAQLITANYLYSLGLGPRVWDVCRWELGRVTCTVFVVEHVMGAAPTAAQHRTFLNQLRETCQRTPLEVLLPKWADHSDFAYPNCNGNLIVSEATKAPQYVDFQNFLLHPVSAWMEDVVRKRRDIFHFGNGRLFRGRRYLYQSMPGASGKRSTETRWDFLAPELARHGLSVERRLVLDVGCNAGMMLYSALTSGAAWAIGWDRPQVIPSTRELLLALGASRFHLIGAELSPQYSLEKDIPHYLRPALNGSVVLYLSVHQHIGLLQSLRQIPWRLLVYEGHQNETLHDASTALAPLLTECVRQILAITLADGDSGPRPLILLQRVEA
jgi:hypothetical protein